MLGERPDWPESAGRAWALAWAFVRKYLLICIVAFCLSPQSSFAGEGDIPFTARESVAPNAQALPTPTAITEATPVAIAEVQPHIKVVLDGQSIAAAVSKDANNHYVRAEPIFKALNDHFEYNVDDGALVVHRSQDGVVMELFTDTGIVKANGKALGKLKVFGQVNAEMVNLTPNAIAVLAGTIGKIDHKNNTVDFKLDPRLKVASGFEIFVSGVPLGNIEPGPKAIGSVMLLPLRPIAKALGHDVRVINSGETVEVRRAQDSALFTLNLDTGLVKLNDRPVGVSKDVTYIDNVNLLLPIGAIETLTGTHIDVEGGSSHINIELDDRLKGAIEPGAQISDEVSKTPFTVEAIEFHSGIDTINTANLDFRIKGINGGVRYEIPDLPSNTAEAQPSWLSVNMAHVNGATGSIGDYAADLRELDGVGLRRIRGISLNKTGEKGRWAGVLGVPSQGQKKISDDQNRLTFGGLAAGVRYADQKGWEAGLSYKKDGISDDQMAVLSAISGRLGRQRGKKLNWDTHVDLGVFNGAARENSVDIRAAANGRVDISKHLSVDAYVSYDGAEFLRNDLDYEQDIQDLDETPLDDTQSQDIIPDIRGRGQDIAIIGVSAQLATSRDLGPLSSPAISVRASHNRSGLITGKDIHSDVSNYGAAVNTEIRRLGTNISADFAGYTQNKIDGENQSGDQITVRAYQNIKFVNLRAQYQSTRTGVEAREQRIDGQIAIKPIRIALPKEARLSATPSIAASWSDTSTAVRGGIVANLDSGTLLGAKTKLLASAGVLQNMSGDGNTRSDEFLNVSIGRKLKINKNLSLGLSYRNDLRGNDRVGVFLDGRFGFTQSRKFQRALDGRGVLKGQAFFDKNRDGIKQDDEPGISGAVVRVKNSRMSLRTDGHGYYTIQNIKEGLHELQVDGRSLPLGFTLADVSTKASIRAGHITDIALPIVQRGQILGFAYIDENADGEHSKGEARLEGAQLSLQSLDEDTAPRYAYATSFGQYAFDDLSAGRYKLMIKTTNAPRSEPGKAVIIDLDTDSDLMARINIAAILPRSLVAEKKVPLKASPADPPKTNPPQSAAKTLFEP